MRRPYFYVALFGLTGCLEVAGGVPSGVDGGADAGGNAARDAGTSAVVDGGTPAVDSGTGNTPIDAGATPPLDAGQPKPVDAGAPPTDAGAPPTDAGPPPTDAGQSTRADGGLGSVDAGPSTVTSFQLTSSTGGNALPFSVGLGFRRGDVPTGFAFELPSGQVDVKRRWPDGSVKHAIASGHIDLVANVPKTVALVGGAFVGGTALRCEDITAAAPSASVKAGSLGTVELSSLLGSPLRTWLSGPEVVECHYGAPVGSDPTLHVFFHVRLFKNGRLFVRAIVENGQLTTNTTDKSYVPTVTVGSTTVFTNGGAALTHYAHTRWLAEGWLGGDPGVVARHDVAALMRTKLVPNYWHKPATEASLNAPTRQYTPMAQGDWTQNMGDTGFQPPIGLLPSWEARYFTSNGDPRALAATLANAKTLNSYGIVWRDTDQLPVQPSKRPTWTVDGEGAGGENGVNAGPLNWELAHHCSGGYLAYLLTGEYFYLETMQLQAATVYLVNSSSHGSGTNRLLSGQTRAAAWSTRTVGQLAGLAPLDEVTQDYRALLASNAQQWDAERQSTPSQALGMFYDYGTARRTGRAPLPRPGTTGRFRMGS